MPGGELAVRPHPTPDEGYQRASDAEAQLCCEHCRPHQALITHNALSLPARRTVQPAWPRHSPRIISQGFVAIQARHPAWPFASENVPECQPAELLRL